MPIVSSGAVSLSDIATEFGGSQPHSMSEYYSGGSNVPTGTQNASSVTIPASGQISLASSFYGSVAGIMPYSTNMTSVGFNYVTNPGNSETAGFFEYSGTTYGALSDTTKVDGIKYFKSGLSSTSILDSGYITNMSDAELFRRTDKITINGITYSRRFAMINQANLSTNSVGNYKNMTWENNAPNTGVDRYNTSSGLIGESPFDTTTSNTHTYTEDLSYFADVNRTFGTHTHTYQTTANKTNVITDHVEVYYGFSTVSHSELAPATFGKQSSFSLTNPDNTSCTGTVRGLYIRKKSSTPRDTNVTTINYSLLIDADHNFLNKHRRNGNLSTVGTSLDQHLLRNGVKWFDLSDGTNTFRIGASSQKAGSAVVPFECTAVNGSAGYWSGLTINDSSYSRSIMGAYHVSGGTANTQDIGGTSGLYTFMKDIYDNSGTLNIQVY